MEYLARKIARAKWDIKSFMKDGEIAADAVTVCLKTFDNRLSFWLCDDERADVAEVVLAMVTTHQHLEKLHMIAVPKEDIASADVSLETTDGITRVEDLKGRHRDTGGLTLDSLSAVARLLAPMIRAGSHCYLFSRKQVLEILRQAVRNGRVDVDSLEERLRAEIVPASTSG